MKFFEKFHGDIMRDNAKRLLLSGWHRNTGLFDDNEQVLTYLKSFRSKPDASALIHYLDEYEIPFRDYTVSGDPPPIRSYFVEVERKKLDKLADENQQQIGVFENQLRLMTR